MNLFMLKKYFFAIVLSSNLFAEDAKIPCRYMDGTLGLNTLESFDCKLANKISSQPQIKAEYKEYVDKKLAVYIARQSSDVIEDLALLDSYFDQNGIDLGTNKNVKDSCKLEKIANVKCGKNVSQSKIQKKLSYILGADQYLPRDPKDRDSSLYKRMMLKALQTRSGTKIKDTDKCPVEGNSGHFTLNSQFTSSDAMTLITFIKKGEKNAALENMYVSYPQLKMLVSGKDDSLKKKFEQAMSSYTGEGTEKKFVDEFFKDSKVQEEMAKSVSVKCDELERNIEKFVCVDNYPHLAMKEDDRDLLFEDDKNDKDDKIFKEVSRGLSCEMEEGVSSESGPLTAENSIHEKLNGHLKRVREERSLVEVKENVGSFCSLYLCQDSNYKNELSCKNGGPISSSDVIKTCPEGLLQKCVPKLQKFISYINTLERDAINAGGSTIASSGNDSSSSVVTTKPRGFSSFYQNFLGVEGAIAAEGKKVTPLAIAEKKAEFVEKKLDTIPTATSMASLSQNKEREVSRVETRLEPITPAADDSSSADSHNASLRSGDEFRRSFQAQQFAKTNYDITKDSNGKSKNVKFTDTESSSIEEMKKLRGDLAEALGKIKGNEEEQLAAVADNNAVAISGKGSKKDPVRNLNSGEKERLDAYRESLNGWENRLRSWQGNLNDRDVTRANNLGSSSLGDGRIDTAVTNIDQSSIANNSGSGAKLSKAAVSGSSSGAKADGALDRAAVTEKMDGDLGVVNSENLATLEKDALKKLGIVAADSFIIKVRYKEKIYTVPVKTFNHGGKSMYVPLLNDKDRELSKIVYESPLFKDYRAYQVQRQNKLENI